MAIKVSFKPGSIVYRNDIEYEVVSASSDLRVTIRNTSTGKETQAHVTELFARPSDAAREKNVPVEYLSPEETEVALARFAKIKPMLIRYHTRQQVIELGKKVGMHYTSLYRIKKKYEETGDIAVLLPRYTDRGGKGKHRLDPAVDAVIAGILNDKDVDLERLRGSELEKKVEQECKKAGLRSPARVTLGNRLVEALKDKGKKGRRRRGGKIKTRSAGGSFPDGRHILDAVQIDHTPLDIILVDEVYRQSIGKAWLTLAIDVFSRMVMGFCVSLDRPGIFSVGQTLVMCILPKMRFLDAMGLDTAWEIYGIPKTIYADNAGEFRAEDFVPFENEYLVEISWRPVARPEYGGHIERLAGTLNQAIHTLPGTTFSNVEEKGDYDSEKEACFTISEIEQWLVQEIIEKYHNTKHSALDMTPRQKYNQGVIDDDFGMGLPDRVQDEDRLKLFLLPCFRRTIQREGVSLDKIMYFHDILRRWANAKDENGETRLFIFRRNPWRISPLYFYDPELKEHFAIPYRDLSKPPMSVWDLKASKKYLKEHGVENPDEYKIFQAYEKQRHIEETAVAKTKKARREREAAKRRKERYEGELPRTATLKEPDKTVQPADDDGIFGDVKPLEGIEVVRSDKE